VVTYGFLLVGGRRSSLAIDLDTLLRIECTVRHKLCAAVSIERLARFDESEPGHFVDKRLNRKAPLSWNRRDQFGDF
jgi:hypothetical protein